MELPIFICKLREGKFCTSEILSVLPNKFCTLWKSLSMKNREVQQIGGKIAKNVKNHACAF